MCVERAKAPPKKKKILLKKSSIIATEKQSRVFTTTSADIYLGNVLQGHLAEESLENDNNVILSI